MEGQLANRLQMKQPLILILQSQLKMILEYEQSNPTNLKIQSICFVFFHLKMNFTTLCTNICGIFCCVLRKLYKSQNKKETILTIHAKTEPKKIKTAIDLSQFLIEQKENVMNDYNTIHQTIGTQFDTIKSQPDPKPIVKGKTGLDIGCQVDVDQAFNFDRCVVIYCSQKH